MHIKSIFPILSLMVCLTTVRAGEQQETKNWFPFDTKEDFSPSVIDMRSWLDKPAGKHGWMSPNGDDYRFEDGTSIKFWGVNICNMRVYPDKVTADRWADYLAKYGVNGVRFHKFTWDGYENSPVSTTIDDSLFNNFDYFNHALKEKGIYTGWSHIYGHRLRPGDRNRIVAYDEIIAAGSDHLKGSTVGLVHFAKDLQDLSIDLTVNLLNHKNPYTGLRYADDPALSYIELQNEDNAFFPTTLMFMEQCPTYKKMICEQFSDWLKTKYGSQEALEKAWGKEAFNAFDACYPNESLDARNIHPMPHMWYFSNECFDKKPEWRKRLYDAARFIFESQQNFYDRYVAAIRATGYKGTIVGSCWQAGDNIGHFYNLYSDYLVGTIDRHNYFGGGGGHMLKAGEFASDAMVSAPGSGLLGTGFQQVTGRPFALSEWMSLIPNEFTPEASPLIALYGLGLQGWDASYSFACNELPMTNTIQGKGGGNIYNADSPTQRGLYPALARMIAHGDILTGDVVCNSKIHIPSLAEGKIGFETVVEQQGDQKNFRSVAPPEAMAVGRVTNTFTDHFEETQADKSYLRYYDADKKEYSSTTGQFKWNVAGRGYFTMNTPCSRAAVGFTGGKKLQLGNIETETSTPFSVVLITSLEKGVSLDRTKSALITTVARAQNSGMEYNTERNKLLKTGEAPLLMEPVYTKVRLPRDAKVYILDHAGRNTGKQVKPLRKENGVSEFILDGGKYRTIYYEAVFK
ncbi:MAG: beta-galactosidase [Bacteroidales bacterium]|nr:beta-galactosidase [Bacteroidales bacterium]